MKKQQLPSPYPLNWFWFCIKFRYFTGPAWLLATTFANYRLLSNNSSFLWLLDACIALIGIALAITILIEASRFTKLGMRLIYIYLYVFAVWNFFLGILGSENMVSGIVVSILYIVPTLLELKYYNRRKILFIHEKEENASYYFDPDLAARLKHEILNEKEDGAAEKIIHKEMLDKRKNHITEKSIQTEIEDLTEKIVFLLQANPKLSDSQIAMRLGVSTSIVKSITGNTPEPKHLAEEAKIAPQRETNECAQLDGTLSVHEVLKLYKQGVTEEEIETLQRISQKLKNPIE